MTGGTLPGAVRGSWSCSLAPRTTENTLLLLESPVWWQLGHLAIQKNLEDCRLLFQLFGISEALFPQGEANNDSHILRDLSLFSKAPPIPVLATQVSPTHSVQGQGSSAHMCPQGQGYCKGPAPVRVVGRRAASTEARFFFVVVLGQLCSSA